MSASRAPPGSKPLIPERYVDVPSQRLYILSLGLLCQAIKVLDFFRYWFSPERSSAYCAKWLFVDFVYVGTLSLLRIPRLNYAVSVVALQVISLWLLDGVLFGGLHLNTGFDASFGQTISQNGYAATPASSSFLSSIPGLRLLVKPDLGDTHLLGQHTVRMSPISTAQLKLEQSFCLASPGSAVVIPVLLNNTKPTALRYSITPLGQTSSTSDGIKSAVVGSKKLKPQVVDLSPRDLKAVEEAWIGTQKQTTKFPGSAKRLSEYDDDDEDEEDDQSASSLHPSLQKTQSLAYIRLNKPGTLRLERVLHSSGLDARIVYPREIVVAPCPSASFLPSPPSVRDPHQSPDIKVLRDGRIRCAGEDPDYQLNIRIEGVPPLSLGWRREINGKHESFRVEGIEDEHKNSPEFFDVAPIDPQAGAPADQSVVVSAITKEPQEIDVPLTVTLDALGTHSYVLESITDGLGNIVHLHALLPTHSLLHPRSKTHNADELVDDEGIRPDPRYSRTMSVLRRPTVAFRKCPPGQPIPLLIGGQAPLAINIKDADAADGPWEVDVRFQPAHVRQESGSRRPTAGWTTTIKTHGSRRDLELDANAPGSYYIHSVRGQHCEGDVLSPEQCSVAEVPQPTAEIEWKRIHECSGDTGVSASLILQGTPPFQVFYRTKRDNEAAREQVKTFQSSRGEFTLQPERSGHYVYTFFAMSDANYKKVELPGPTIDQTVHPLAAADFAEHSATGRNRKINSCSGDIVNVDVDLKGTGPWNLEFQVASGRQSETISVKGITANRHTARLPIPKEVNADGGTFNIDLVSVEDAYGCKRPLSVPGMSVNVRRIKPTAKFYSKDGKRHVTILEKDRAQLPMRLTGEGPWHVRYRRRDSPERTRTATISNPNDNIPVTEQGVYELLEVEDSQCPGSVYAEESTYEVSWVPRPYAKLSSNTQATFESYNGSHIISPVCERTPDHVDLDLNGRPPFEIMYNVARRSEFGGSILLDQPTFSSIQPSTRFQLHVSEPGRIYYEVKQIGDAAYPLAKHKDALIPRDHRLLFEQEVLARPSAQFQHRDRMSYCLGDTLTARDSNGGGAIALQGTPPFQLEFSVKSLATSEVFKETVEIKSRSYNLDLPSYRFQSIGPHLVTVESVNDASRCEQAMPDPLYQSIWVDVAESAAIVPFDRREHFCVGEVSRFQLEGIPPWTIDYTINGKSRSQEAKVSPFSLVQKQPGEFVVTSIAHQQHMCKASVPDLRYSVHPLPSAQVGNGKRVVEDIHEGDQAEIVFSLIGEPPFTFTYQRAELAPPGRHGKVLETHTISGVTKNEYSIFSALEGTWTVTFISDRYCRYPLTQDAAEKPGP